MVPVIVLTIVLWAVVSIVSVILWARVLTVVLVLVTTVAAEYRSHDTLRVNNTELQHRACCSARGQRSGVQDTMSVNKHITQQHGQRANIQLSMCVRAFIWTESSHLLSSAACRLSDPHKSSLGILQTHTLYAGKWSPSVGGQRTGMDRVPLWLAALSF